MGRLTIYNESYMQKINEYLATTGREQTVLPTIEGFAEYLGLHRDTLYEWEKIYPECKQVLNRLRDLQKLQLMNDGLYGGKDVNATMAIFLLKVNHGMIEKNAVDLTTGGKPLIAFDIDGKYNSHQFDQSPTEAIESASKPPFTEM